MFYNDFLVRLCKRMYWDVKTVNPLADYQLYVEVEHGRRGIFDVKPYLDNYKTFIILIRSIFYSAR